LLRARKKNNLHKKVILFKDVKVHLYSSNVSYDLENETTDHTDQESPCFPADRKSDLSSEQDDEYTQIQSISWQCGCVIQISLSVFCYGADGVVTLILLTI
jgi:hypothetical protein